MRDKIKEWHKLVIIGLNNGLTHTIHDGRRENIEWVRMRMFLFNYFTKCIMDLETNQDWSINENNLKRISEEGWEK